MSAHDVLHLGAVGLAVVAALAHPGWRSRKSWFGLGACAVMLVAMIDAVYLNQGNSVFWSALLIVAALAIAAVRSSRRRAVRLSDEGGVCMNTHDSLGLIATAGLLPLMHGGSAPVNDAVVIAHAGHGATPGALLAVVLAVAAAHVLGSAVACVRSSRVAGRFQYGLMGGMTVLMAASIMA